MSIRATYVPQNSTTGEATDPIPYETTYDGNTFTWVPGKVINFADDGVGIGHIGNATGSGPWVVEDNSASAKKDPDTTVSRS